MRLPILDEENQASFDVEQINKMVDTFIEKGFTYFDTAYMYHDFKSEEMMGKALIKRHNRDEFTITSKMPLIYVKKEEDLQRIFDEQKERLGIDFFDYYLLHNITCDKLEKIEKFKCFEFILKKKEAGEIKHIGFSFHDKAEVLDKILTEHPEVEFVQLQINYLDWEHPTIQSRLCYETARKHGKSVIIMEPVKGGTLASLPKEAADIFEKINPDASPASWAVRFAADNEGVMMVLSGMSSIEQLEDNTSYMSDFKPLTEEEKEAVWKVRDILNESITIPCTACRYCVDGCPKHIAIPEYFSLFNAEVQALNKGFSTHEMYYYTLSKENGKASECIECGQCERACPQHIEIIKKLKDVAKAFE